jgi:hypothetical protein
MHDKVVLLAEHGDTSCTGLIVHSGQARRVIQEQRSRTTYTSCKKVSRRGTDTMSCTLYSRCIHSTRSYDSHYSHSISCYLALTYLSLIELQVVFSFIQVRSRFAQLLDWILDCRQQ